MSFKFCGRWSRHAVLVFAAGLSCTVALADAKTYRLLADFDAGFTADYTTAVEMFGNDMSYVQLNNNFGPQGGIAAQLNFWLLPQVTALGHADMQLSYDRQSPQTSASASGNARFYRNAASPIVGTLSGLGGSAALSSGATLTEVLRSSSGTIQQFYISSSQNWLNGPLAENSLTLQAPAKPGFGVDLKSALADAYSPAKGALAGIQAFDSLPVRLTVPQTFGINSVQLFLQRFDPVGHFDNLPIDLLDTLRFEDRLLQVSFSAKFGVTVDRADYSSDASFDAAKSWVDGNLRQIDYDIEAAFMINSVTEVQAVPEPTPAGLMLAGLGLLAWRARRQTRMG